MEAGCRLWLCWLIALWPYGKLSDRSVPDFLICKLGRNTGTYYYNTAVQWCKHLGLRLAHHGNKINVTAIIIKWTHLDASLLAPVRAQLKRCCPVPLPNHLYVPTSDVWNFLLSHTFIIKNFKTFVCQRDGVKTVRFYFLFWTALSLEWKRDCHLVVGEVDCTERAESK